MLSLNTPQIRTLKSARERREAERHKINRLAKIQARGSNLPRDCLIVDVSDSGIRIHAEYVEVPDEFIITISGMEQARRECRVVWRLGFEVGAEFTDVRRGFAYKVVVSRT
jgi:hypothetical protein